MTPGFLIGPVELIRVILNVLRDLKYLHRVSMSLEQLAIFVNRRLRSRHRAASHQ